MKQADQFGCETIAAPGDIVRASPSGVGVVSGLDVGLRYANGSLPGLVRIDIRA